MIGWRLSRNVESYKGSEYILLSCFPLQFLPVRSDAMSTSICIIVKYLYIPLAAVVGISFLLGEFCLIDDDGDGVCNRESYDSARDCLEVALRAETFTSSSHDHSFCACPCDGTPQSNRRTIAGSHIFFPTEVRD